MMLLAAVPDPATAKSWIQLFKEEPVIIAVGLIGLIAGFLIYHLGVRKGLISTPTMNKKMAEISEELEKTHIENAELRKEMAHMQEGYEKYHELLNSFLAARKLELMDKMAMEHGEKKESA